MAGEQLLAFTDSDPASVSLREAERPGLELLRDVDAWLFDFDNTLQMGDKLELRARLGAIATLLGMDFTQDEIEQFGDRSDFREMRSLMLSAHAGSGATASATEADFQSANNAVSGTLDHHFYLADYAEPLLRGIRAEHKRLALVTTRGSNSITRLLHMHGVADYFDVVVNRDDCEERKPHPAPIRKALLALGIEDPSRAVYVGDKQVDDVAGGHNAGTLTVLINENLDPTAAQPDFHLTSLKPLADLYEPK